MCDGSYLEVTIYDINFQKVAALQTATGSSQNCRTLLDAMPFGTSGRVYAGQQLAFCDGSYLEIYGVLTNGTIRELSNTSQGGRDACWLAARSFNDSQRY